MLTLSEIFVRWNFSVGHHEVTYTPASEPNIFTERDSDSCDAETQACPEPSGKTVRLMKMLTHLKEHKPYEY